MASPDKKSFLLRIDPELWAEIERLAAAELRSVNAQVEYLLRDAVAARRGGTAPRANAAARRKR
ncbi:MAG TPA: toxin-antitoxin system HicB family antitoxin [Caldimonas sp.]